MPTIDDRPPKPASFRRIGRWALVIVLMVTSVPVAGYYGLRFLFLGRFTVPTTAEYAAIAQRNQPIAQAIADFRADHGTLPSSLADLVPKYLSQVPPPSSRIVFLDDVLIIHAGVPRTDIIYTFRDGEDGWRVGGDWGTGLLPVPKPIPKANAG